MVKPSILRTTKKISKPSFISSFPPSPQIIKISDPRSLQPLLKSSSQKWKTALDELEPSLMVPLDDKNPMEFSSSHVIGDHKCKINEFGAFELTENIKKESLTDEEDLDLSCKEIPPSSPFQNLESIAQSDDENEEQEETILCCLSCGCYGMSTEFHTRISCSYYCQSQILENDNEKERKKRERLVQKVKRERKRGKEIKGNEIHLEAKRIKSEDSESSNSPLHLSRKKHLLNGSFNRNYPWYDSKKHGFSWSSYLEFTGAKAAPSRLFKNNSFLPSKTDWFKVGMKLEAIDPEHPYLTCVVTIADIQGLRLRCHIDGYSESYDFWENADSLNLFYVGWSGHRLLPPKEYSNESFNWSNYLRETMSVAAPEKLFRSKSSSKDLYEWKIGSKLEAVDKQNTSLVCVASVSDVLDGRILIHFDGWEREYDYWVTPSSPYIHPKGWCKENGITLNPPNDYPEDKYFDWDVYSKETNISFVPPSVFSCTHDISHFKKDMKVEVVDIRNPIFIRVASITEIDGRQLKIHFDGWSDEYDIWIDDENPNIHPPNWAEKTGHVIMPPLTPEEVHHFFHKGGCPTPGCRGLGHIRGAKYVSHHTLAACPYSSNNMNSDNPLPDRLIDKKEEMPSSSEKNEKQHIYNCNEENNKNERHEKENDRHDKRKNKPSLQEIRESVFRPFNDSYIEPLAFPLLWEQNSSFLVEKINGLPNVLYWSVSDVVRFVLSLPGIEKDSQLAEKIYTEEVDGESFTLLTQADLVKIMGLKLGPAIKIYHAIQILKTRSVL